MPRTQNSSSPNGGAPLGNKNGLKLKKPEVRQQAYQSYCDHLAKGKSKRSWCFEHPEFSCTWETIEKYLEDEVEFDPLQKKMSETKGYARWEQVVEDSAIGLNPDANTASLQMLMRNKFGWDKERSGNNEHRGDIARLADALRVKFEPSSERSNNAGE
jgi:hypothetical protein